MGSDEQGYGLEKHSFATKVKLKTQIYSLSYTRLPVLRYQVFKTFSVLACCVNAGFPDILN